jgi:type VI protein secretion system component VasK
VSVPLLVVLTIGMVTTGLLVVILLSLWRHLKILSASLKRFRTELEPAVAQIQAEGAKAQTRMQELPGELPTAGPGARIRR